MRPKQLRFLDRCVGATRRHSQFAARVPWRAILRCVRGPHNRRENLLRSTPVRSLARQPQRKAEASCPRRISRLNGGSAQKRIVQHSHSGRERRQTRSAVSVRYREAPNPPAERTASGERAGPLRRARLIRERAPLPAQEREWRQCVCPRGAACANQPTDRPTRRKILSAPPSIKERPRRTPITCASTAAPTSFRRTDSVPSGEK